MNTSHETVDQFIIHIKTQYMLGNLVKDEAAFVLF